MTQTEHFLGGYKRRKEKIETLLKRYYELKLQATCIGSFDYEADRVMTSLPSGAGFEAKIMQAVELEKKIAEEKEIASRKKAKIDFSIGKIKNEEIREIMYMKYIDCMTEEEIAEKLEMDTTAVADKINKGIRRI